MASTFAASLEMAKEGKVVIRQAGRFGRIYVQGAPGAGGDGATLTETEE